jgi:hypothetical protein
MTYTIYDPATGQILELFSISDDVESSVVLANSAYIPGSYDANMYYVDQAQAVIKPARPLIHWGAHYFDYATKTWQLDLEQLSSQMRQQRDQQLAQVDRVNPVWYATLTDQQRTELAQYRQDLLAVPQQAGFPEAIDWPTIPQWL